MAYRAHYTNLWLQIRPCIARLRQSSAYDLAMRLPVLAWATALALASAIGLEHYVRTAEAALPGAVCAVEIAMRVSVIAYLVIIAAATIMRQPAVGRSRGAEPRISALLGTFLITAVVLFPRRELSLTAGIVSSLLIFAGDGLAVLTLIQLRRSFSIMPEARELVTSGPYRLVRHPLYLAEGIAATGSILQFLSFWTVILLAAQILFQLRRINNEEAILTEAFPYYAVYREKTARVVPGIY
jgi:protein-S-isoprenylcysteine O-methyltransferase Ste14